MNGVSWSHRPLSACCRRARWIPSFRVPMMSWWFVSLQFCVRRSLRKSSWPTAKRMSTRGGCIHTITSLWTERRCARFLSWRLCRYVRILSGCFRSRLWIRSAAHFGSVMSLSAVPACISSPPSVHCGMKIGWPELRRLRMVGSSSSSSISISSTALRVRPGRLFKLPSSVRTSFMSVLRSFLAMVFGMGVRMAGIPSADGWIRRVQSCSVKTAIKVSFWGWDVLRSSKMNSTVSVSTCRF